MSAKRKVQRRTSSDAADLGRVAQTPQRMLPGIDKTEFRQFMEFSSGVPTKVTCPRCGYAW